MLATDECLNLEEYAFKSSPESCSSTSYFTDYTDLPSDEDFLQQLSSDLDIPLLLNPGEDEMSLLNSFLDRSPSEIMSEIAIPLSDDNDDKFDEIAEEFSELQQLDMLKCKPNNAFPTVQSEIKLEPMDCNSSTSSGSEKSDSPIPRSDQSFFELKHEMKCEPLSPCSISSTSPIHSIDSNIIISTIPNTHQFSPQNPIRVTKLAPKRVAIQPKAPYTIPSNKTSKMVLFKNNGNNIQSSRTNPKVLVLENVTAVPVKNVAQLTSPNSINNQINNRTVSPVFLNNKNLTISVGNIDPKAFKRQQRKIKNRESACLSRKKKKDYLTSLENKVKDLATANQKLKLQNFQLQERLAKYEGKYLGNGGLNINNNTHNSSNNVKNSIVLCIFLFSLGFHLDYIRNPFSLNNQVSVKQTDKIKVLDHHGRNLLWVQQEDTSEKNSSNFLPFSMCPASINQTESARLVLELERWIGKPKDSVDKPAPLNTTKLNNKYNAKPRLRKRKLKKYDNSLISSVLSLSSGNKKVASNSNNNEIQVFSHDQIYSEFFEAINRQDDTFYVVSFSDHHMLLPALHHNKTRRPKMSLIMPSMLPNANSSKPLTYVPLMQIDCEVLDTRLIQIRYGSIPQHLREQGNSTTYENNDNSNGDVSKSSDSTAANNYTQKKAYRPYFIKQSSVKPSNQSDLAL